MSLWQRAKIWWIANSYMKIYGIKTTRDAHGYTTRAVVRSMRGVTYSIRVQYKNTSTRELKNTFRKLGANL